MNTSIELFIIGLTLSFGPCLLFCSPVILPYIAATKKGWREGLKSIIIFSLSRLVAYTILGLLVGLLGRLFTEKLHKFDYPLFILGGLFIASLGILIIFGKEPQLRLCQILRRHTVDSETGGLILLGLTVGFLPCLPLLGVLTYIALKATSFWQGALYGFSFGMGTAISPLILFGVLASFLPGILIKSQRVLSFFKTACVFLLLLAGVTLRASQIFS